MKKTRRPDDRPDEILDAATALFSAHGFDAVKMDAVADKAGLSKGALYLYFKSKDALFEAIIARFFKQFGERLLTESLEIMRADPKAAIHALIMQGAAIASDAEASLVPRLVIAEAARFPNIAHMYRQGVIDRLQDALGAMAREGARQGDFVSIDPDILTRLVTGPLIAQALLSHVITAPTSPKTDATALGEALCEMVFKGLAP